MRKLLFVGALAVGLFATGCGGTEEKDATEPIAADGVKATPTASASVSASATPAAARAVVDLAETKIGKVLVGEKGRTLYLFEKDKNGKSACSGPCAQAWPPFVTSEKPRAGNGIKENLLGTTKREDGETQVTYNGHPLYYYIKDQKPGDTTGQDVEGFGAEWYAVNTNGERVHG
jgi:predicted lipoprotein with Yx(FWY)xxD motif